MVEVIQVQVQMDKHQVEVEQLLSEQMRHQMLMELVELVEVLHQILVLSVYLVVRFVFFLVVVEQEIKMELIGPQVD